MSLLGLLNQTITIYAKSSYGADGREIVGAGVTAKSRFQLVSKRTLLPRNQTNSTGSVIEIDAIAYVPASTTVATDDKVSYGGSNYKVITRYAVPGAQGTMEFIKLELQKWQST